MRYFFHNLKARSAVRKNTHFSIHVWHTTKSDWGQISLTEAVLSYDDAVSEFAEFLRDLRGDKRFLLAFSVGTKNTAQLLQPFEPPQANDFAIVAKLRDLMKDVQEFKHEVFEDFPTKKEFLEAAKSKKTMREIESSQLLPKIIMKDCITINGG